MKETNPNETNGVDALRAGDAEDDEDIDITCNSSCNLHYHIRKHATSVLEWFKKLFKKIMLFI